MVKLRLTRMGSKGNPFYRIVAIDERKARSGKYLECVGYYNPMVKAGEAGSLEVDSEKALKWINNGAQPTDTVRDLFKKTGIIK